MPKQIRGFTLEVDIHKESPLVTKLTNIANAETPILRITPGENQILFFPQGNPIRMKLFDTGGNEIDVGAVLVFKRKDLSGLKEITFARVLYAPWANLALSEQFKADYDDVLGIGFTPDHAANDAIHVPPGYVLEICLKASAQIDWNNPNTVIFFGLGQELMR